MKEDKIGQAFSKAMNELLGMAAFVLLVGGTVCAYIICIIIVYHKIFK